MGMELTNYDKFKIERIVKDYADKHPRAAKKIIREYLTAGGTQKLLGKETKIFIPAVDGHLGMHEMAIFHKIAERKFKNKYPQVSSYKKTYRIQSILEKFKDPDKIPANIVVRWPGSDIDLLSKYKKLSKDPLGKLYVKSSIYRERMQRYDLFCIHYWSGLYTHAGKRKDTPIGRTTNEFVNAEFTKGDRNGRSTIDELLPKKFLSKIRKNPKILDHIKSGKPSTLPKHIAKYLRDNPDLLEDLRMHVAGK